MSKFTPESQLSEEDLTAMATLQKRAEAIPNFEASIHEFRMLAENVLVDYPVEETK